jgi:DNA repair protein RadC
LQEIEGIGEVAPVAFGIIREAASLYLQQSAENIEVLSSPESIKDFWRCRLWAVFAMKYLKPLILIQDIDCCHKA